jgi:hypothetical protein
LHWLPSSHCGQTPIDPELVFEAESGGAVLHTASPVEKPETCSMWKSPGVGGRPSTLTSNSTVQKLALFAGITRAGAALKTTWFGIA